MPPLEWPLAGLGEFWGPRALLFQGCWDPPCEKFLSWTEEEGLHLLSWAEPASSTSLSSSWACTYSADKNTDEGQSVSLWKAVCEGLAWFSISEPSGLLVGEASLCSQQLVELAAGLWSFFPTVWDCSSLWASVLRPCTMTLIRP